MNNIKAIAAASIIVASLSVSAYALSQSPSASRADDTTAPSVQEYTAPDASTVVTRDAATATQPEPTTPPMYGAPKPVAMPPAGSAASIPVPPTVGNAEPGDRVIPPCENEDSPNCYWDAATMGDGTGTSFINWDGVYYYPEGSGF